MPDVFSVPIFFIVFRESLEASIIVSVLLALVEQIVHTPASGATTVQTQHEKSEKQPEKVDGDGHQSSDGIGSEPAAELRQSSIDHDNKLLVKRMRKQVFLGAGTGFAIALAIGAAFLAVWFTSLTDLFGANEELWEGSFNLVAAILIFIMGLTMLRIDKAKAKWRVKLQREFVNDSVLVSHLPPLRPWQKLNPFKVWDRKRAERRAGGVEGPKSGSKWTLFLLPFVTVLREGLEAIVFIGGVSLGQKATAIPLATICGLICGLGVGYIIYSSSSRTSISTFLIVSTNLLLLVGAGLFSKAVGSFERHKFNKIVGADVSELGDGPGSFDVRGNIWHLNCCNPENRTDNGGSGWTIFAAIFGWSNNGSVGTVLAYIFYWVAAIVVLVVMQMTEKRRRAAHAAA
ncbi:high-affinity iron permease [Tulasnella sp. JGI-2019a]|nr:high-affinity iron permease [Tulasnella sp. JGI-2019a]